MNLLERTARYLKALFLVTSFVITQWILCLGPPLLKRFHETKTVLKITSMETSGIPTEEYMWDCLKRSTVMTLYRRWFKDSFYKEAEKNKKAPNPKVLTEDGKSEVNLLDSASPGRPLVLNFGSCS